MLAEQTITGPGLGNPTVDVVMQRVVDAIRGGCAFEIDDDAEAAFRERYTSSFAAKLEIMSWTKSEPNVLKAARNHGIIAQSIATLRRQDRVNADVMLSAGRIVQENCLLTYKEFIWCWGPSK
jgi:hypothetical protein